MRARCHVRRVCSSHRVELSAEGSQAFAQAQVVQHLPPALPRRVVEQDLRATARTARNIERGAKVHRCTRRNATRTHACTHTHTHGTWARRPMAPPRNGDCRRKSERAEGLQSTECVGSDARALHKPAAASSARRRSHKCMSAPHPSHARPHGARFGASVRNNSGGSETPRTRSIASSSVALSSSQAIAL